MSALICDDIISLESAARSMDRSRRKENLMAKKKEEITIRSSTAEYLTYIASVGDVETSFEMRYEDEKI